MLINSVYKISRYTNMLVRLVSFYCKCLY